MKVLYYSSTSFIDCDFPLVKALIRKGIDVYYLIHVAPYSKNTPLFPFRHLKNEYGIFNAREYPEMIKWGEYLDLDKVYILNDSIGKAARIFSNLRMLKMMRKFTAGIAPDILHIVEMPSYLQFPLSLGKRTVYTIHDPRPHSGEYRMSEEFIRKLSAWTSSGYFLLNDRQDTEFSEVYKIPDNKIFHASLGRYECYEKFGTGARIFPYKYFLFFGRLSPYKGVEYAVRAFKTIMNDYPDIHFVIAGSGNAYFKSEITDFERITLINRYIGNDELADMIRGAEFVICPYTDATQSGVVQTAYAFNKPVVATEVGNLQDVVLPGKTGFLVQPSDSDDLAMCLDGIFKDVSILDSMSEEIKNKYGSGPENWDAIAGDYIDIYNKVWKR